MKAKVPTSNTSRTLNLVRIPVSIVNRYCDTLLRFRTTLLVIFKTVVIFNCKH